MDASSASEALKSEDTLEIKWTQNSTIQFINLRIKFNELFTGKRRSAAVGYTKIAQEMNLSPTVVTKKSLEKNGLILLLSTGQLKHPRQASVQKMVPLRLSAGHTSLL
ncbi:uncharacterized protein [Periplaneta americana]|uniref:uncharacterized protein n=1 Tax=Periplaneta americana TaxID=6978 RepID=UPI0037E7DFDF